MRLLSALCSLVLTPAMFAVEPDKDGFVPLFNGKDLTGWSYVNTPAKTFYVKDNMIVTTGTPTGYLRSDKQYENFVLEMEWMHANTKEVGNSGLFVWGDPIPAVGTGYTRGIEVQVLVNLTYRDPKTNAITASSHGDLFSIWGARCKPDRPHPLGWERCLPSEDRAKGGGEWNHYRVEANNGVIKLHVNGKEVSGVSECTPRKGYLALESEGAECKFRNLKIKELPSTNPKSSEIANVDQGFKAIYNGLDLDGLEFWIPPGYMEDNGFKATGGRLVSSGRCFLATKKHYGPCELVFDWKVPAKSATTECVVFVNGRAHNIPLPKDTKPGNWSRATIKSPEGVGAAELKFVPREGLELMNLFVRELK